ncbi:energy-converting hydrogenase A subunit A EhaA [Methanobacterium sp.]|uniref:energy-converting hydrogenase A subunit A EhaA n=1 Tax=Methanobacterium sp. TaxID=2164 RepID=UPI003C7429D4
MFIHAFEQITILSYILAVAAAMVVGLILRIPILPERPMRYSWTISIIFPTSILALGFTAMLFKLGYTGMLVALIVGILTAVFAKYFLERLLPRPQMEESA